MPTRVANVVEKNVICTPTAPVIVPAGKSTQVLANITTQADMAVEYAGRYIQNNTGANLYYAFDAAVDSNYYNGILQNLQQLDCSNHGCAVNVFSQNGGAVAITLLRRKDLSEHETMFPARAA